MDLGKKALGFSMIAGARSMSGPALLAQDMVKRQPASLDGTWFGWLRSPVAGLVLGMLALGEMGADKLPDIPARIAPQALAGRMMSGALIGAAYSAEQGESRLWGALSGALVAGAATFITYAFRMGLAENLPVPQQFVGTIEDAVVVAAGVELINEE